MRIILLVIAVLSFGIVSAQQINPIPDYVFKNQMSVGRNSTTDTAAYMSIGPRFGATKGMMPPMVVDTASFSGSKRNGLLIFSVQKNKFLYWDSVRVQWSDMAGSSGQYITGTVTSGKIPKATSSTVITDSRMSESGLLVSAPRFKADSMLFLPKMSTTPTDTGAIRYALADSVVYVWTGSQWIKAGAGGTVTSITAGTGLSGGTITSSGTIAADTTVLSTRLWRQKAVDSLQANINLKVNISDTATMLTPYVRAAGYGLTKSSQSLLVDTAAMATRARVQKGIDSLAAIRIAGSGTINRVPKFTGSGAIGDGSISDSSTSVQMTILSTGNIGIGTVSPLSKLHIVGTGQTLTVNSNNAAISIKNSTKEYFHQIVDANNRFRIFDNTASLERITLLTNGDVGISAASPLYRFHTEVVNSTAYTPSNTLTSGAIAYFYNNTDANATVASTIRLDAGNLTGNCATTISAIRTGNADAALTFGTRSVGSSVTERVRISADGEFFINTTTDAGDYKLQVSGNIYNTGSITTGAPSGGSIKPWKLGEAATVSPTSPNRTIRVEIDGTVYYLHAKTTND